MRFVIVGTGRCGTRLLTEMLNRHPDLLVVNESHFLSDFRNKYGSRRVATTELVDNFCRHRHATYETVLQVNLEYFGVDAAEMKRFFVALIDLEPNLTVSAFYERVAAFWMEHQGKRLWADETPDYGCFLGELRQMWPDLKVIHVTRDGLSVGRSMLDHIGYRALISMNVDWWGTLSPLDISWGSFLSGHHYAISQMVELWARRYLRISEEISRLPADACVEVTYDDLLTRPAATLDRLARFAGLNPDPTWARDAADLIEPEKVGRPRPSPADLGLSDDLSDVPTARRLLLDALPSTREGHTIVGLAMVKNEEEIIEPFVRHNLQFVDVLCVLENGSVDRTRDILVALQREGLPVVVFDDPQAGYLQSEKMTRLLKAVASTMFPDFVVPLDADEFIKCSSKEQFVASVQAIPPGGVGYAAWHTYVTPPSDAGGDLADPPRSMVYRRVQELPQYYKVISRLDGHFIPELIFTQGNHAMERTDHVPVTSVELAGVALGHFPVRNARQMEAKAIVGWMAYLVKDPNARHANQGYQWQEAFDQVIADGGILPETLSRLSMMYAQQRDQIDWDADAVADPMNFRYERRYGAFPSTSILSTIAKSIEDMLATPAEGFAESIRAECVKKVGEMARTSSGRERSSQTVFDSTWHYDNLFLDLPPFHHLIDVCRPESVLDIGCGIGSYLLYFVHHQVREVFGIDGIEPSVNLLPADRYLQHDLSQPFHLGQQFDLVLCVEVVEHLAPDDADRLLEVVAEHAKERILFSAAEPGQPGKGHINCRPIGEWLEAWRQLGWQCDVLASLSFRALSTFHWLRRNPVVLRRGHDNSSPCPVSVTLEEIARKPFTWHPQTAAVHSFPLSEDLPPDLYE